MDKSSLRTKWTKIFDDSLESDSWGQIVEASEGYEKLCGQFTKELNDAQLPDDDRNVLAKLKLCLTLRNKTLHRPDSDGLSVEELRLLRPVFQGLFTANKINFPLNLSKYKTGIADDIASSLVPTAPLQGGTLLPRPPPSLDGGVHLSINIEKIGLKEATQYLDPFITISVLDQSGRLVETQQDTPVSNQKKENYILFGCNVEIQTQVNTLPPGTAIVFEFKHFKPKGEYNSCKCWCFMELDEIKSGPAVLEIYKKPTDSKRKKLRLLSVKPLYLHLNLKETVL